VLRLVLCRRRVIGCCRSSAWSATDGHRDTKTAVLSVRIGYVVVRAQWTIFHGMKLKTGILRTMFMHRMAAVTATAILVGSSTALVVAYEVPHDGVPKPPVVQRVQHVSHAPAATATHPSRPVHPGVVAPKSPSSQQDAHAPSQPASDAPTSQAPAPNSNPNGSSPAPQPSPQPSVPPSPAQPTSPPASPAAPPSSSGFPLATWQWPADPASNYVVGNGSVDAACGVSSSTLDPVTSFNVLDSQQCIQASLDQLSAAASEAGLSLSLPSAATLMSMPLPQQLMTLVNDVRVAYGLGPLQYDPAMLSTTELGAEQEVDPPEAYPPGLTYTYLGGGTYQDNWSSDWAESPSAPAAVYGWIFDDGWGGSGLGQTPNYDCTGPGAPGCWGHRNSLLSYSTTPGVTAYAAAATYGYCLADAFSTSDAASTPTLCPLPSNDTNSDVISGSFAMQVAGLTSP